jgi:hypothetical protein
MSRNLSSGAAVQLMRCLARCLSAAAVCLSQTWQGPHTAQQLLQHPSLGKTAKHQQGHSWQQLAAELLLSQLVPQAVLWLPDGEWWSAGSGHGTSVLLGSPTGGLVAA